MHGCGVGDHGVGPAQDGRDVLEPVGQLCGLGGHRGLRASISDDLQRRGDARREDGRRFGHSHVARTFTSSQLALRSFSTRDQRTARSDEWVQQGLFGRVTLDDIFYCSGWSAHQRFWQSAPGDARSQEFVIDFGGERKVASVEIEWEVR